ncbi:hydrogenase-4 subunit G [Escherichia coli]|nr:hydrogenase-4 subunit G [Escherichia coli]
MNVNSSSNRGEAILAALKTQFPGAVLDEERQTPEQVTITVKINLLPDVVQYLYYHMMAGFRSCLATTSGHLTVITRFIMPFQWKGPKNAGLW